MGKLTEDRVREALNEVYDPEIPVLSIVELGVVRGVSVEGTEAVVELTPTFSACPAFHAMLLAVEEKLRILGAERVVIRKVLEPAWSTDWLSEDAKEKLRRFGLAPPRDIRAPGEVLAADCPYCGSSNTELRNSFGCTACRAISFCLDCRQPFEQLKAI